MQELVSHPVSLNPQNGPSSSPVGQNQNFGVISPCLLLSHLTSNSQPISWIVPEFLTTSYHLSRFHPPTFARITTITSYLIFMHLYTLHSLARLTFSNHSQIMYLLLEPSNDRRPHSVSIPKVLTMTDSALYHLVSCYPLASFPSTFPSSLCSRHRDLLAFPEVPARLLC